LGDSLIGISGMVHEEGRKSEQDAKRLVSTSLMAKHLERHGVNLAVDEVQAHNRSIGEVLKAHVDSVGADLLVMGAYGHSRFREFVLGGATKSMLTHPPCALFMSH
jgi:nucleotide-binding universal stress UspA family protein